MMRTAIEKENEDDKKSASSLVCPNCEGSFQPIDYANWMDMELVGGFGAPPGSDY